MPNILRIINNDYTALVGLIIPGASLFFGVLLAWDGKGELPTWLLPAIGIATLTGIGLIFWRVTLIRRVFEDGVTVPGTISLATVFRDRGRLEYTYFWNGEKYRSGEVVHRSPQVKSLEVGSAVKIVLDPDNPKKAFIKELFVSDNDGKL